MPGFPTKGVGPPTNRGKARRYNFPWHHGEEPASEGRYKSKSRSLTPLARKNASGFGGRQREDSERSLSSLAGLKAAATYRRSRCTALLRFPIPVGELFA